MSNVKITELTAETNPVSTDVLPIVDVTADETKKVTIADLLKNAGSGDAAAPGVAFDEDSDTGMYRSGPNALGFATGGVGRFFIDSSGNITIGLNDQIESELSDGTTEYLAPIATGITASNVNTKVSHFISLSSSECNWWGGCCLSLEWKAEGEFTWLLSILAPAKTVLTLAFMAGSSAANKSAEFRSDGGVEFYGYVIVNNYLCAELNTSGNGTLKLGSSNSRIRGPIINLTSRDVPEVIAGTKNESVVIDAGKLGSTNDAAIHLKTGAGNTTSDRLVITSSGTVEIPGSLTIGGTAAANTIDEYEVGTFTPAITSSTSPTQNYITQGGDYVKIGDLVYVRVKVKFGTSITPGSGVLVCNLPFSAATYAGGTIMITKLWGSDTPVMIQTQAGNASCALKRNLSNDGVDASNVQDNTEIHFSIVYQIQ